MTTHLVFGGRPLLNALDDIRRYCGLPWSGGAPEVFAYRYFDTLTDRREDDEIRPVDVLSAAAVHPGFRKVDLAYFAEQRPVLEQELQALPPGLDLADASEDILDRLATMGERLRPAAGLSILSKVLHTKRPRLVPMLDRAAIERYRHDTHGRGEAAWSRFVELFANDLAAAKNRLLLREFAATLHGELSELNTPSELRLADIAIWMEARPR